jgi:hypothetical protein
VKIEANEHFNEYNDYNAMESKNLRVVKQIRRVSKLIVLNLGLVCNMLIMNIIIEEVKGALNDIEKIE